MFDGIDFASFTHMKAASIIVELSDNVLTVDVFHFFYISNIFSCSYTRLTLQTNKDGKIPVK